MTDSPTTIEDNTITGARAEQSLDGSALPDGLGINCTSPAYLEDLTDQMSQAIHDLNRKGSHALVIYPDGGLVYDGITKTWSSPITNGTTSSSLVVGAAWAEKVGAIAKKQAESGNWNQVIVGGCCKAGVEEIRELAKVVRG